MKTYILMTFAAMLSVVAVDASASGKSADCFFRKPNGNIVLHHCKHAQPKAGSQRLPQLPPLIDFHPRRILVVPVGPSWDI
jgi:hypothetical protein